MSAWRRSLRDPVLLSALVCILAVLASLPIPRVDGHWVGSDGLRYFATLRSLVFDHDLNFTNDYALLGVTYDARTPLGLPANPFPIGPALLWLPFYLVGCGLAAGASALGFHLPLTGVGLLYEAPVCVGTAILAGAGFLLLRRTVACVGAVSGTDADTAILAMWWATPAIYYIVAEPSMSHALAIFANAVFLRAWLGDDGLGSVRRAVRIGLAAALIGLVRWQDSVMLLLPACELIVAVARGRLPASRGALCLGLCGLAFGIGMMPQVAMWRALYGSSVLVPQGNDFFQWLTPHPWQALFSLRHGLLTWHPVFALSLAGIALAPRSRRGLAIGIFAMFLVFLYVNSAATRWWADDAFGGRRFVSLIPLFCLSTAWCVAWLRARIGSRALNVVLGALVFWNALLFVQYRLGWIDRDLAPTWQAFIVDRLLVPVRLARTLLRRFLA